MRELVREICHSLNNQIIKGHVWPDHVHLLLSGPPSVAPSRVMKDIKGKTSHHLMRDFRTLRRKLWGSHLWARGYFAASSGNVTDDVLMKYIERQDVASDDDDNFKVTE